MLASTGSAKEGRGKTMLQRQEEDERGDITTSNSNPHDFRRDKLTEAYDTSRLFVECKDKRNDVKGMLN